ncbi:MAG: hypothetical protein RSB76_02805, partial [Clostridia bacterium]
MNTMMYNSLSEEYKLPFGSVKQGEEVKFNIKFDVFTDVQNLELVIFKADDWYNREIIKMSYSSSDLLSNIYTCSYIPKEAFVYFYYFTVTVDNQSKSIRKDEIGFGKFGYPQDESFQLTVYSKETCVSDFMQTGIYYQIFPDRFYKSNSLKVDVPYGRKYHYNWNESPDYLPNKSGQILNNDFFGGDLQGIIQKLNYIKSL